MRKLLVLLALTRVAHAGRLEYGAGIAPRTPQQLEGHGCELTLELKGAVVDAWMTEHVANKGPEAVGSIEELTLPVGAQLIDARVGTASAVAVPSVFTQQPESEAVAADPMIVTAIAPDEHNRPRFRAIVSPIEPDHDVALAFHWTAVATIARGALHLALPGRACHVTARVTPGAGATLAKLRVGDIGIHGGFDLTADAELIADLSYTKPLVWTQVQPLADGYVARATTQLAPMTRGLGARRALLMIDGSRSMKLVNAPIAAVVRAIAGALPAGSEVEAVVFDRTPTRVLGSWKPIESALTPILDAVTAHPAANGSDAAAALTLAHNLIAGERGETLIVMITDGALGVNEPGALADALATSELAADFHAIVLDRGELTAPDREPLERAVARYGGSYVEVDTDHLDDALVDVDTWLRPSSQVGDRRLRAGTGIVGLTVEHAAAHGTPAPIAQLALAQAGDALRGKLSRKFAAADDDYALAVLATAGTVARQRRETVAGGGPFTRMTRTPDPAFKRDTTFSLTPLMRDSAIDHQILDTLFKLELQPKAYVCYEHALANNHALAGTAIFHLEIGRGEVTRASVDGLHDPAFDACLTDAAYILSPPMPDPVYNTDDRSLVTYPITFSVHESKPLVIPGDADSATPLDIDAIERAGKPKHIEAGDTKNPLGGLKR
jgi:Mg-chelatase subunit ChlD